MKSDMKKIYSDFIKIKTIITHMMAQKQNSLPGNMDSLKAQDPDTVVPNNKKAPLLGGGNSMKLVVCGLSKMRQSHQNYMN